MKTLALLFLLNIITLLADAQYVENVCYIDNNRIHFQLNKQWSQTEKTEFTELFDLDSVLVEKAFLGMDSIMHDSVLWHINHISEDIVVISRPLNPDTPGNFSNDVLLRDDDFPGKPVIVKPVITGVSGFPFFNMSNQKYGINRFKNDKAFSYLNGVALFHLKGFKDAGQVYLSGSFNNWSTRKTPMVRASDGWMVSLELKPGKYEYKYIIDGRWTSDPVNRLREFDGHSGSNSIIYCYNHTFELAGYQDAKKIYIAGSFNNWQPRQLLMKSYRDGWYFPLFLEQGTHFYKFIVDGTWITDPASQNKSNDAYGNENSFLGIGDTLMFRLNGFEESKTVVLTGNFNNWSRNEITMHKVPGGWEYPYVTGPGNYEYKFIVDGIWITDPDNPCKRGSGEFTNSCISFKPNHTFFLPHFSEAESVIVTGSFNNWDIKSLRMNKTENGWVISMFLDPGKHTYKFIVDNAWLIDPANPYWEENEYGTGNSVLWIME